MTKKIEDGGPAFPQHDLSGYGFGPSERGEHGDEPEDFGTRRYTVEGMSLRDHFASQALVALGTWMPVPKSGHPSLHSDETLKSRAEIAYRQADAMIAARKSGGEA